MELRRALTHLLVPERIALRPFPAPVRARLEQAIEVSERSHAGEVRLVLEAGMNPLEVLQGRTTRDRAQELFSALGVWDTEDNTGVLVYLQMVDHRIEIVADRGISRRVPQSEWDAICRRMEAAFRSGRFEPGVLEAIGEITELLDRNFPAGTHNPDELPDRVVVL
jgi:uncharacterized membrane protein